MDAALGVLLTINKFYCRCTLPINTWQTDELEILLEKQEGVKSVNSVNILYHLHVTCAGQEHATEQSRCQTASEATQKQQIPRLGVTSAAQLVFILWLRHVFPPLAEIGK